MDSIELRHLLHQTPELSLREFETQKILLSALREINDPNLKIYKIAGTGIIALYTPNHDEEYIIYRADMDGLPISEETNWEFSSQNSNMHACGHDVHMAIAYELIKKIVTSKLEKNFAFIFQPGEETGAGAKYILDEIENLPIKAAFALHVTDEYEFKTIATNNGTLFASSTEFDLTFIGKSSHIAFYENGIDSIKIANEFLNEFYKLNFENSLVKFGKIEGGNARNVVAAETTLQGTIRTEKLETADKIIKQVENLAKNITTKYSADFSLTIGSSYPAVIINNELYEKFKNFASKYNINLINCDMKFTGEDFGYFSQSFPSLMFWAGTLTADKQYGLHSPKFLPDDKVIPYYADIVFNFLKELEI